jgi:hypothetical protein
MKIIDIFRRKIIIFIIQILILNLFIFYFRYQFGNLFFNLTTTTEQITVIQLLANYVLFYNLPDFCFIYIVWIIISLIPIMIYLDYNKAYKMNLITYCFPNFFLYIFLIRFATNYIDIYFQFHFLNTLLLGIIIIGFSIGLSLILEKIKNRLNKPSIKDLESVKRIGQIICPNCGIKYESIPKYCYKCNRLLTIAEDND